MAKVTKPQRHEVERRAYGPAHGGGEIRASADKLHIEGHAALFNVRSEPIAGVFYEVVMPGAFDRTLRENPDIRVTWSHERSNILGRTRAGTAKVMVDELGLFYEVDPPNTENGRSAVESVRRGDVSGSSFTFRTIEDHWRYEKLGDIMVEIRELIDVDLIEVAPVAWPAYSAVDDLQMVSSRALDHARDSAAFRGIGAGSPISRRSRLAMAERSGVRIRP